MNANRKSDEFVLPTTSVNKVVTEASAEPIEERNSAKRNIKQATLPRTLSRNESKSRGLLGVREAARKDSKLKFTALLHHINEESLTEAFFNLNKTVAVGVDEVTWHEYKQNLQANITDLHGRIHRGAYRAKPSRRVWIPKPDGRKRPLGIASLEDKIVQQAMVWVLQSIYEEDFLGFSYGFRIGRSQHDALDALSVAISSKRINWILDADIEGFFDTIDHEWLIQFLEHRIGDRRVVRLIRKWLRAGISEEGQWSKTTIGAPQGSVISPLLANAYLHEVLDTWFAEVVTAHCRGKVVMYRYADDFVIGCELESDARRIMKAIPQRFARFGLAINEEKTRMISFRRPPKGYSRRTHGPKPGTFSFLGFTHYWGKTRKGGYTIKWKTDCRRLRRSVSSFWQWCRAHRHRPVEEQYQTLCAKLRGHYQYYGIPFNTEPLGLVHFKVTRAWRYWLNRRGGRKKLDWPTYKRLLSEFVLPSPRIVHGWDQMGSKSS